MEPKTRDKNARAFYLFLDNAETLIILSRSPHDTLEITPKMMKMIIISLTKYY